MGSTTVFFVLDSQTQLAQAELALVQAQTGYQTAVASIDHATGRLLERHRVKLVPLALMLASARSVNEKYR